MVSCSFALTCLLSAAMQVASSSLAVTIANVTCPAAGDASVAAIAIATAAKDDRSIASQAIAGVLYAGVDVTAIFEQAAVLATPQRRCGLFPVYKHDALVLVLFLFLFLFLILMLSTSNAHLRAGRHCRLAAAQVRTFW